MALLMSLRGLMMFDVKFIEAIAYGLTRNYVLGDEYYNVMTPIQRKKTVSIAGLGQIEQVRHVMDEVRNSIDGGGTFAQFQKAVADGKVNVNLPEYRLANIFRTNIQSGYNHGKWQQQQRTKAYRPYLMYDAINDNRTRPNHLAMDEVIRHIDDPWWLTHTPLLGYQCFLPNTTISGDIQGAIVRSYEGVALEFTTKSNRRLSVTSNHPILTSRGWVRADCINIGDNVLGYNRPVDSTYINGLSVEVNNEQVIPTAENLFKAFISEAFALGGCATLQFNSDVTNGKIDINIIDDRLSVHCDTNVLQGVKEFDLVRGDHIAANSLAKANSTSLSHTAIRDIVLSEDSADISVGAIKAVCEGALADMGLLVKLEDFSFEFVISSIGSSPSSSALPFNATRCLFDSLPLDRFRLGLSSEADALTDEVASNGWSADAGLFSYLIDAHSVEVFADPVVNIGEVDFSGHVYDFQSKEGILSSGDIISHNCRCSTRSLTKKQAEAKGITEDIDLPDAPADSDDWGQSPREYAEIMEQRVNKRIAEVTIEYFKNRAVGEALQIAAVRFTHAATELLESPIPSLAAYLAEAQKLIDEGDE